VRQCQGSTLMTWTVSFSQWRSSLPADDSTQQNTEVDENSDIVDVFGTDRPRYSRPVYTRRPSRQRSGTAVVRSVHCGAVRRRRSSSTPCAHVCWRQPSVRQCASQQRRRRRCPPHSDINDWTRASRLRLNPTNTQIMWLGTSQQLDKITVRDVQLLSTEVTVVDSARNFGVIIDSQLSLDAHVAAVCRSGYYQLRQVRPVTRSLSADAAKTLVQVFISSRLDYCNALLYGVSDGLMCRLQSVQNAATRLVTNRRAAPRSHQPILRQLHWLPVRQRVTFKIAVLVFQWSTVRWLARHRRICGGRLSAYFRRQHAPTPIDRHSDVRRPTFK